MMKMKCHSSLSRDEKYTFSIQMSIINDKRCNNDVFRLCCQPDGADEPLLH